MNRKFQYAVLIGRFQSFHFGRQRVVEQALRCAERVLVVLGSDSQHRSVKNPCTLQERERMIRGSVRNSEQGQTSLIGVPDAPCNDSVWTLGRKLGLRV